MSDQYGVCQMCGRSVEAYARDIEVTAVRPRGTEQFVPGAPLVAEPCGHDQPRPVIWRGEALTHPTQA